MYPFEMDFTKIFRYDHERGVLIRIRTGKPATVRYVTSMGNYVYGYVQHKTKLYLVHRVVWAVVHGSWPRRPVKHLDYDKRNNRIENLVLGSLPKRRVIYSPNGYKPTNKPNTLV
jgi:hypothetical protein